MANRPSPNRRYRLVYSRLIMIENIENIEQLMDNEPSQLFIDGIAALKIGLDVAATGNEELINILQDGRNTSV